MSRPVGLFFAADGVPRWAAIGLIVLGVLAIAGSRVFAEAFKVPGDTHPATRFLGFGDDYKSDLRRWATAVVIGLALILGGIAALFGG
jgi:hypothetical protein